MIECTGCDSPTYLRIVDGDIEFDDGDVSYVEERFECVRCDSRGLYRYVDGVETVAGCVRRTEDAPESLCAHKRRASR